MNTHLLRSIEEESREADASPASQSGPCTSPALGELLPDYIAELLADSIAEEMENHFLDCLHCREKHLKVLGIGDAIRKAKAAPGNEDGHAPQDEHVPGGAKMFKLARFKKGRP